MDNAAIQAIISGCSDALIYLTNATIGPCPDPALIQEIELELAEGESDFDDDEMNDFPSPAESNDMSFSHQDLVEVEQGFPAPWKDL